MPRAGTVLRQGDWSGEGTDAVSLDFEARSRRRLVLTCESGMRVLLDLPRPAAMAEGDALQLDDGRLVTVCAAPEELLEVRCESQAALVRAAWHLGNRHLPTEIAGERLYIRYDHVIEEMLHGLGAQTARVSRPFQPEGGAYAEGHGHSHSHGHDHGHGHSHDTELEDAPHG